MFILASTHRREISELQIQIKENRSVYRSLAIKYNQLVARLNAKGGMSFLDGPPRQLDDEDIRRLIMLCHPDKHDGKQMASDMTKKLLTLRS